MARRAGQKNGQKTVMVRAGQKNGQGKNGQKVPDLKFPSHR